MKLYMGIDPGYSGAVALVGPEGKFVDCVRLSETEHDVSEFISEYASDIEFAILEKVNAMPRQGVSSTFKFGTSYGFCRALLVCHRIRFETAPPGVWVTKSAAQRLIPEEKVVHATADSMLIAEYARRKGV